jgi:hypothetical protein
MICFAKQANWQAARFDRAGYGRKRSACTDLYIYIYLPLLHSFAHDDDDDDDDDDDGGLLKDHRHE